MTYYVLMKFKPSLETPGTDPNIGASEIMGVFKTEEEAEKIVETLPDISEVMRTRTSRHLEKVEKIGLWFGVDVWYKLYAVTEG